MSTVKAYNVDSGDTTNLVLKTNGTTALTINGTTQAVTFAGSISGNQTVTGNLSVNGNTTLGDASGDTLTVTAGTVTASNAATVTTATGALYPIVSGTAQASTSGTSIDFTGIPSWVKRVTVMFNGVSTSGTSNLLVQLGDSGGVENTGYVSTTGGGGTLTASTAGFILTGTVLATSALHGGFSIVLLGSNAWVCFGSLVYAGSATTPSVIGGSKTLSDTLDRVRITTVNGTDTFDAGSINILYE
jgi:hypothetical protein